MTASADAPHGGIITRPFLAVLLLALFGFTFEQVLRPVIPLIIIDRGGDVLTIGVIAAVYSLPSAVFRPFIGLIVDGWSHGRVLLLGAAIAAASPFGVLAPGIVSLAPVRFIQGSAWALFSVSTHTYMAKLAPPRRRGEAAGYFMATAATAGFVGPAAGVALYLAMGTIAPVLLASVLALAALVISRTIRERDVPREEGTSSRGLRTLVEPSALPGTLMLTMFMAAFALFTVFPAVYLEQVGGSPSALALYYPAFGVVMTLSQLVVGRVSDSIGRGRAIRIGCLIAIGGLAIAGQRDSFLTLTAGAAAYAVAMSLVTPAISAMTIDRAPIGHMGSAMATYSLAFGLATGVSSPFWGAIIAGAGFRSAFAIAIVLQVITVGASLWFARSRTGGSGEARSNSDGVAAKGPIDLNS